MEPSNYRKKVNLYDLSYDSLKSMLSSWGYSHFFADKIWHYLYVKRIGSLDQIDDLREDILVTLKEETRLETPNLVSVQQSADGLTTKYLLALADNEQIECVLMQYDGRSTACISSQVGCAMGCVFCATGQMGFGRNLSSGEIVSQVVYLLRRGDEQGETIRNIVFMGMGEPLHNYSATMGAIETLTDDRGLAFGPRYVTVSTIGLPTAIRRLADERLRVNLAVSLHAATENERRALVPITSRWTLGEVLSACKEYSEKSRRRIFFEWALIAGINDSTDQAKALGRLLQGMNSHVNLIPVNPTKGYKALPSDDETARMFQFELSKFNIPSTVRQKRGIDILAGCGQLRTEVEQPKPSNFECRN
ncbi:MAG TPA: 23S rRNA (adenine(2503)-C(2))-methyltransferase RlmN [candidate division Zixibacteria bacterium]|nr:23S rRNA (adenine(2503)-C(2))-methyltransferase RlmN [candidate division Zixibacteria bacterium]